MGIKWIVFEAIQNTRNSHFIRYKTLGCASRFISDKALMLVHVLNSTYKPGYKSRNYDENNYNLILKHRQDYFRNSFFIRSVELWNSLPSHVKSSSTFSSFKGHLHKLYLAKLMHYVPPGWVLSTTVWIYIVTCQYCYDYYYFHCI